jgi:hypothetical protein
MAMTHGCESTMDNLVSRGGLLRALNKDHGPRRKLRLNLGVCVTEEYNPLFGGHRAAESFHHPLNGRDYVKECIEWAIRKVRVLVSMNLLLRIANIKPGSSPRPGRKCEYTHAPGL